MSLNISLDSIGIRGFFLPEVGFWAAPESVGLTYDDALAYFDGRLSQERQLEVEAAIHLAVRGLGEVVPAGVADWMPPRRAMS